MGDPTADRSSALIRSLGDPGSTESTKDRALDDRGLPRPDVNALADFVIEVIRTLETGMAGLAGTPGLTIDLFWTRLEKANLTHQETMSFLGRLKEAGWIGAFLNLAVRERRRRLWHYLRDRQVSWQFVTLHWEPSPLDSSNYFAGFMIGAAQNAVEGVIFLAKFLLLSPLEALAEFLGKAGILTEAQVQAVAEEKHEFFLSLQIALEQLLSNPVSALIEPLLAQREAYNQKLYALEFYEAGILGGKMVSFIVSIPNLLRSIFKVTKALKALRKLTAAQLAQLLPLDVIKRELKNLLTMPPPRMVAVTGLNGRQVVMALDDATRAVGVFAVTGEPLGAFPIRDIISGLAGGGTIVDDIEEAANSFETPEERQQRIKRRQAKLTRPLPEEPELSNGSAPYDERVAFIERHRHRLTPENGFSAQQTRNLNDRIAQRGDLAHYEKIIDGLLTREYIDQLNTILPFRVTSVSRIPTRGTGPPARGGEVEIIVRSLRTGQPARISFHARSDSGINVQIDDLRVAKDGVVPSEIKSGLNLQKNLDADFESFLDANFRELQEQMGRHADFAADAGVRYFEWVAFSKETADALDRVYRTLTKSQREYIKIVLEPFFE